MCRRNKTLINKSGAIQALIWAFYLYTRALTDHGILNSIHNLIIKTTPERYVFFFIRYETDQDLGFLFDTNRYQTIFLASEMTFFFLGIYCLTTFFLGDFFDDLFLGIFLTNWS